MKTHIPGLILIIVLVSACSEANLPGSSPQIPENPLPTAAIQVSQEPLMPKPDFPSGYTYPSPDGNHYLNGQARLPDTEPLVVPLNGQPAWVVGSVSGTQHIWLVALENGQLQAFLTEDGQVYGYDIETPNLAPGQPPALISTDDGLQVLAPDHGSPVSHPVTLPDGRLAYITDQGQLVMQTNGESITPQVTALPDARILQDSSGQLLLLSDPSELYDHGVLADPYEAGSFTLVDTDHNAHTFPVPESLVIEGIFPIWTDINGDGDREILATLSNASQGAQLAVFNQPGELIAAGDPIGQGYRWRHLIAAAPFGPQGQIEVVDVLTPHIGGTLEFFQLQGDRLVKTAEVGGLTSHVLGTRNLDMSAAADFDGDGMLELLLPTQDRLTLAAVQRTENGAQIDWQIPLGSLLVTNLALSQSEDGQIGLALGLQNQTLLIWAP